VLYILAAVARRLRIPFGAAGPLRVEDPRCAGRVRVGEHDAAGDARGVNFILHVAGWLEGGLAMGYEKFMMDATGGDVARVRQGLDLSPNGQALDAILANEPGTHFSLRTLANFETRSIVRRSPTTTAWSSGSWRARRPRATREHSVEAGACRVRAAPIDEAATWSCANGSSG